MVRGAEISPTAQMATLCPLSSLSLLIILT